MSFLTDKQTLDDLNLLGTKGKETIYSLFNEVQTRGAAILLEQLFQLPLSDKDAINERTAVFRFFQKSKISVDLEQTQFDNIDAYLADTDERSKLQLQTRSLEQKLKTLIVSDTQQQQAIKGIESLLDVGRSTFLLLEKVRRENTPELLKRILKQIEDCIREPEWEILQRKKAGSKLSLEEAVPLDQLFRFSKRDIILKFLDNLYQLDIYFSVAAIATEKNWVFAQAISTDTAKLSIKNLRHPQLANAVPNSILLEAPENIIFLTGANMAGKSTLMKSIGIAVYLAHMGFPVAADAMEFSVKEGLLTTINLSDNINMGYSHFYAEVKRVKKMAELVGNDKNMFFIVDELFRGTNVKDAEEATIAVISRFARRKNSMLIVSTHIMEAGTELGKDNTSIQFLYLPTTMCDGKPVSTYTLEKGITNDRHGMLIIENEGILDLLKRK